MVNIYCSTLVHDAATLRFLVERIGVDHVVLGGDHTFQMRSEAPVEWTGSPHHMKGQLSEVRSRASCDWDELRRLLVGGRSAFFISFPIHFVTRHATLRDTGR
jgi:hypothetical protein